MTDILTKLEMEDAPPIFFRKGTSDEIILSHNIGDKSEYQFPEEADPKIIFDVGANIGFISILMAQIYPNAKIYAFEPEPNNFAILKKNIEGYPNIEANNVALGSQTGSRTLLFSDDPSNFGGFTLFPPGSDQRKEGQSVTCVDVSQFVKMIGGRVDMIKIDAEGAEWEVLSSLTTEQRQNVTFILGELHGTKDFETLQLLSEDFELGFNKPLRSRVYQFCAQRKKAASEGA